VLDADRHDYQFSTYCALHFAPNLRRAVSVRREQQQHHARAFNSIEYRGAPFHAWTDVARRYPAADVARFEFRADRLSIRLIASGVTDEYVVRHFRQSRSLNQNGAERDR